MREGNAGSESSVGSDNASEARERGGIFKDVGDRLILQPLILEISVMPFRSVEEGEDLTGSGVGRKLLAGFQTQRLL